MGSQGSPKCQEFTTGAVGRGSYIFCVLALLIMAQLGEAIISSASSHCDGKGNLSLSLYVPASLCVLKPLQEMTIACSCKACNREQGESRERSRSRPPLDKELTPKDRKGKCKGKGKGKKRREGDWFCPSCGRLIFSYPR